ncbi:squalene monooxygenase SE1-like [Hevea brasiliensis]|uniref:squalene monooxygenase SE1-like n=1 Tax=Hevea brasiliensis TaxID=3981 RepID=UPI0025DD2D39|nr:squalene monooxygenase SE1-like [Hevea brasiliensis]
MTQLLCQVTGAMPQPQPPPPPQSQPPPPLPPPIQPPPPPQPQPVHRSPLERLWKYGVVDFRGKRDDDPAVAESTRMKKTKESRENVRDEVVKSSEQVLYQSENAMNTNIIIVGAGVVGSALAYTLGKDGRRVHVIERNLTLPDRIVGELLQPGGYLKLIELGLEDCVEEIDAQQVFGYALYKNGRSTKLSYPLQNFDQDVAGRSFHNGRFIQRMREKAASLPNVRLEEGTVTALLEVEGTVKGVQYKTKIGQELTTYAPLTIVDIPSCFVALIIKNCELPYPNHGHVILADPFMAIDSTEN